MPITTEAESTAGSRRRSIWCRAALGPLALFLVAAAALAACDSDSPDPTAPGGPEGPDPSAVTLEANQLDAGGTGVVVSDGFADLELEPAVDDDGAIIPDRWTNLRVTVGGREADVRRLDERTMEFAVPILPGGTYGVDVASPLAHGSASARVFGVIASEQVVDCFILNTGTLALIPVGDALVFDTHCGVRFVGHLRRGVGAMWPAVPHGGFQWLPEGEVAALDPGVFAGPSHRPNHFVARRTGSSETPDFWVWEGGPNPRPIEPLDCFGTAEVSFDRVAPAELSDGSCLLIASVSDVILRNGEPISEWPRFTHEHHFVMSDDGWVTIRNTPRLGVFDPAGELMVAADIDFIRDARFAPGGGPLYVATEEQNADEATLMAIDRATGDVLRETTRTGTVTAIAASEERLWIARTTPFPGDELIVELLDPETLETRRSIAVARNLATDGLSPHDGFRSVWPFHGLKPVLLEDATGTRLTYAGLPQDWAGLWSHVVEVF